VVVGDSRTAVFDDTAAWQDKLVLYPKVTSRSAGIAEPEAAEPERVEIPVDEPLSAACEHFLHCIRTGCTPTTDGNEWLRVLRVVDRSRDSLDRQGMRVQHPLPSNPAVQTAAGQPSESCKSVHIHPSAIIEDRCNIGPGSRIWQFAHIMSNAQIGEDCSIGQNVVIGQDVKIGRRCKIRNNVSIFKGVTLEESVFCGPSVVFTNVYIPRAELGSMDQARPTLVQKGAAIGANATVVCGVMIGRYALVGAGAVVTRNVPDFAVVVGNPGRQIGWACICGESLTKELECRICHRTYQQCPSGLKEKVRDEVEAVQH
jgi:UDP-2-acetamido-3-amino-2,3-dideoxy-glucuronate N-acetyltransferase